MWAYPGVGDTNNYIFSVAIGTHFTLHPPPPFLIGTTIGVGIFSIFINVSALSYFYHFAEKKLVDKYSKLLLFIFVFLNGGILMWTNGVRWYAYWVPLFIILYTLFKKEINMIKIIFYIIT